MRALALAILGSGRHLLLEGPVGVGKTISDTLTPGGSWVSGAGTVSTTGISIGSRGLFEFMW